MSVTYFAIVGLASGQTKFASLAPEDFGKNMLEFLHEKGFPIASSCRGRGACHRCVVNDDILLCDYSVKEFIEQHGNRINVSYL